MPQSALFSKRFAEVIGDESQHSVGQRLGVSQTYVSRMLRGRAPSRELVQRIAAEYGLDEGELLTLAGYGEEMDQERLVQIALRGAEQALRQAGVAPKGSIVGTLTGRPSGRRSGAARPPAAPPFDANRYFVEGIRRLIDRYGPPYLRIESDTLPPPGATREDLDRVLGNLERDILDEIEDEKRRNQDQPEGDQ
jgi:transcriptional regulator with XRE-family HTH domain